MTHPELPRAPIPLDSRPAHSPRRGARRRCRGQGHHVRRRGGGGEDDAADQLPCKSHAASGKLGLRGGDVESLFSNAKCGAWGC